MKRLASAGRNAPVPELSIPDIIRTLNEYGVRYVVIGGVAAYVHNLPLPMTIDLDVTPSRDDARQPKSIRSPRPRALHW